MRNFNFKNAFEALAAIATATIPLCLWLTRRAECHYWMYFIFRRDGKNSFGIIKTTDKHFVLPTSVKINTANGIYSQEISREYYELLSAKIDKWNNQQDDDTDTDNQ